MENIKNWKTRKISEGEAAVRIADFLNLSYKDYMAARVLLNEGLLLQGVVFSATTVEKLVKAVLLTRGESVSGHLLDSHLRSLLNYDPKLYKILNIDYLQFLQAAYKLRYFDDVTLGYKLVMEQKKVLAELDFTFDCIYSKFSLERNDRASKMQYHNDLENNYKKLFENNFVLNKIDKIEFIRQRQFVYEIGLMEMGLVEVYYETENIKEDYEFITRIN